MQKATLRHMKMVEVIAKAVKTCTREPNMINEMGFITSMTIRPALKTDGILDTTEFIGPILVLTGGSVGSSARYHIYSSTASVQSTCKETYVGNDARRYGCDRYT